MENLEKYKIVIYILLALFYFVFKGRKKKTVPADTDQKSENRRYEPAAKPVRESKPVIQSYDKEDSEKFEGPVTLEDLLKGLNKKQEDRPKPAVVQKSKVINYEENVVDEEDEIAKRKRSVIQQEVKPVTEEEYTPYVPEKNASNEYGDMLNDPEKLKKVFVAQEIFNPKHF